MPGRISRVAAVTLAATVVGCYVAPRGSAPPPASVPAARDALAGLRDIGTIPLVTSRINETGVAFVTFQIGGRGVQALPDKDGYIAIAFKSKAGENLIRSAKCGTDTACYKSGVQRAVFKYDGTAATVTLEINVPEVPVTKAIAYAEGYALDYSQNQDTEANPKLFDGQSTELDLRVGQTASADVTMTATGALGKPPEPANFYPKSGGPGVYVAISGKEFQKRGNYSAILFGSVEGIVSEWATVSTDTWVAVAQLPSTAALSSGSIDGKPISVKNRAGTVAFASNNPFTLVSSLSIPAISNLSAGGAAADVTNDATSSQPAAAISGGAFVQWSIAPKQAQQAGTPTPAASSGGGGGDAGKCNPVAPATAPPECFGGGSPTPGGTAETSTPMPSAMPTEDISDVYLEWADPDDVTGNTKIKGKSTGQDSPQSVKVYGVKAGDYEIKIKTGILEATRSVKVQ